MAHLTAQTSADQQFAREWAEARVGAFDNSFAARYAEHFPELHRLFLLVYGERADGLEALAELVALALRSWNERPGDLKALDADLDSPVLGDRYAKEAVERIDFDWAGLKAPVKWAPTPAGRR